MGQVPEKKKEKTIQTVDNQILENLKNKLLKISTENGRIMEDEDRKRGGISFLTIWKFISIKSFLLPIFVLLMYSIHQISSLLPNILVKGK